MDFMTNREFAEHMFKQEKRNTYTNALIKEVRRLMEENAELRAERDALKKCKLLALEQPIDITGALAGLSKKEPLADVLYQRLEAINLAQNTLRSEAERSRGCCYCNTGEPLNGYEDVGSFIILPKGKKYYLEIAFSNDFYSCATDINFCPNCGKRLEVEP